MLLEGAMMRCIAEHRSSIKFNQQSGVQNNLTTPPTPMALHPASTCAPERSTTSIYEYLKAI